jgi:beta-glucuronidase
MPDRWQLTAASVRQALRVPSNLENDRTMEWNEINFYPLELHLEMIFMLYPIINNYRYVHDLSGLWKFRTDPDMTGEQDKWYDGFESDVHVAVPGSWNEQLEEEGLAHYTGSAWYFQKSFLPDVFYDNTRIWLRVGSADYYAKVWVNGKYVGENVGGFLPFVFDITDFLRKNEENAIAILVNNELTQDTIPQGIHADDYSNENRKREEMFPPARFDFYPYGGIHRPVQIFTTPKTYIADVTIQTKIHDKMSGSVLVRTHAEGIKNCSVRYSLSGDIPPLSQTGSVKNGLNETKIDIESCRYWSPADPYLYTLTIELIHGERTVDTYSLPVGIREVTVEGNALYLNGERIFLKGFGKHEDFPVTGKGVNNPLMVKDFGLLKWINANSFRTSHYPYADEIMHYADRKGYLVIDEVPAVSLDFRYITEKTKENHKQAIERLYQRDKNHPCVIMWAVGNEPNLVNHSCYFNGHGKSYWKEIFEFTRTLDRTRPITVPNCQAAGPNDPVFEFCDVISINRYYGWYENPGQLEYAVRLLEEEMDFIANKFGKPIFITEFGADTVSGFHSTSDQMFTEEYQAKLIRMYCELIESKEYAIGEHVWNFADFRTSQHFRRVILNLKGVFTRTREPKLAAFTLKEIWSAERHSGAKKKKHEMLSEK